MKRPDKKLDQAAAPPFYNYPRGDAPNTLLPGSLRALIDGLFGKKKTKARVYQPTQQEIADYYLTPREREIAYLAALDFSDKEIADALAMNFQTVRVHLRNIMHKLGVDHPRELREYFDKYGDSR